MEITKKDAQEARKILKAYERKRNAEKRARQRARQRAMPCAALVHEYLKRKNDGYGYDAWDADAQKLYRAVKSAEQYAMKRRRKGIVDAVEMPKLRRIRWTDQMKNALQDGDTAYLKACGLTDNAISSMRWKLAHEAIKEAV